MEVRQLRDDVPTIDIALVWHRGSGLNPAASEFTALANELSRQRRA